MRYAILYSAITITMLATAPITFAGSASVINDVSVSANSGGNTAGFIKEGTSRARVFIKTIVNGEVVEYIDETVETSGGEEAKIEKETHYEEGNAEIETKSTAGESEEIAQDSDSQTGSLETQNKEVGKNNTEVADKEPSFVAVIFQKLINYVFSIFGK